jgi:surface protein
MRFENKKQRNIFIFCAVFLLIIIVGATYAYFGVNTISNFGTTTINATAGGIGTVALNGTSGELRLNLSAKDMMKENANHYYATADGTPSTTPNTVTIGQTSVVGTGTYTCNYSITVTQSGDLYTAFQSMAGNSTGQIELRIGNTTYDFSTANLFPITATGTLTDVRSDNVKNIVASFKVVNRANLDQSALKNKTINISMNVTNFECNAGYDKNYNNYLRAPSNTTSALVYNMPNGVDSNSFESIVFLPTTDVPTDGSVTPWDISYQQNGSIMASYVLSGNYDDYSGDPLYILYIGQDGGVVANEDSSYLFADFYNAYDIDLEHLDTSMVENMSNMFYRAGIYGNSLDLTNFDTSNVKDMSNMFYQCGYEEIDVSAFDTSSVENMAGMFSDAQRLTSLDLKNFDTSNVTDMSSMFYISGTFSSIIIGLVELDVSNFDTSNVTNMDSMFAGTKFLTSLDLSNFDTSNVTNMDNMFQMSGIVNLDLSSFDISNVNSMNYMFDTSRAQTLDLSSFDTSNNPSMLYMFHDAGLLQTIYVSDLFVPHSNNISMFFRNGSLVGGNGTHYSSSNLKSNYARIDSKEGRTRYFTRKTN